MQLPLGKFFQQMLTDPEVFRKHFKEIRALDLAKTQEEPAIGAITVAEKVQPTAPVVVLSRRPQVNFCCS
jgi:hypothetical protein